MRSLYLLILLLAPATLRAQPAPTPADDLPTTAAAAPRPSRVRADYETNPAADPARPTVTNPAHIPPPGYLQFEQGLLEAAGSPGLDSQFSLVQTTKLSLNHRILIQAGDQPFAHTSPRSNDTGDLTLGAQFLFNDEEEGHSNIPTIAIGYNGRIRSGTAPNLDTGGYSNSVLLLVSGDLFGLHYDTNYLFNEQPGDPSPRTGQTVRRLQFGQTLSVTRQITKPFSLTAELWHFTQPLVTTDRSGLPSPRSNAVGFLLTPGYTLRPNIVLDCGFDRGLTSTSTIWEGFAGITYLLPHRVFPARKRK